MQDTQTSNTQVLIVGAGPVGLTLANLLASQGVAAKVVTEEAEQRPVEQSRAEGNHGRTLALYERLGVLDQAFSLGRPLHGAILHERDRQIGRMVLDDPHSYYPGALILGQARVERMLEARLNAAGVPVERGWKLAGLEQGNECVTASLHEVRTGERRTVTAPYLVACDGGRSAARKMVGAEFAGQSSDIQYALADVEAEFPGKPLDDDLHIWLSPLMILGRLEDRHWKAAAPTDPDKPLSDTPEAVVGAIQEKLNQNGVAVRVHSPRWTSVFRISTRRVNRMRFGRVFLAGDAAHIHSPMGGQGMNEGMQDALNLAWKLASVLRHGVTESLLDTYNTERQPIIEAVLKDTAEMTRLLEMPESWLASLRNVTLAAVTNFAPLQPVVREQFAGATRNYRQSSLVSDPQARLFPADSPRPGDRAPDAHGLFADGLHQPRRLFSLWQGSHRHELLLFTGESETEPQRAVLASAAQQMEAQYGERLRVRVVTRSGTGSGIFWLDSASDLHRRLGAERECAYLVRPDGFIAFRGAADPTSHVARFLQSVYGW